MVYLLVFFSLHFKLNVDFSRVKLIKCFRFRFVSVCGWARSLFLNIVRRFFGITLLRNVVIASDYWEVFGLLCQGGCQALRAILHRMCGKLRSVIIVLLKNQNIVRGQFCGFSFVEQYSVSVSRYFCFSSVISFSTKYIFFLYECVVFCVYFIWEGEYYQHFPYPFLFPVVALNIYIICHSLSLISLHTL